MKKPYNQFILALALTMIWGTAIAAGDSFNWIGTNSNWNSPENWQKTTNAGEHNYPKAGDTASFTSATGYVRTIGTGAVNFASSVAQIIYEAGAPSYSIKFSSEANVAPPIGKNAFINNSTNNQNLTFQTYNVDQVFSSGGFSGKGTVEFVGDPLYPSLAPSASGTVSWDADTVINNHYWTIDNMNEGPLTVNVTGNVSGTTGIHLYGTNGPLTADFSGTNTLGEGFQLGTDGERGATLKGDTNSIKNIYFESPSTVIFRDTGNGSPSADVYNSEIVSWESRSSGASILYSPQYNGSSLEIRSNIPALDRDSSTDPIINVQVTKGTLILSGENTYAGDSTIHSGATLAFKTSDSYPGGPVIVASGGTLDLSRGDISAGSLEFRNFSSNSLSFSPGSNLVMNVNSIGHSAQMSLYGEHPFDLSPINLIIRPEGDATDYQDGQTYGVFTNKESSGIISPPSSVQTTPNTFPFAAMMADGITIKLVRKPNQNVKLAVAHSSVGANNDYLKHRVVRGVLSEIRGYAAGNKVEMRPNFNSFRPTVRAVNPGVDFLNMTEGGVAEIVQDTMQQWSPLRNSTTGVWVQPFGMILQQGKSADAVGYKTRTGGILFGIDHKVRHDMIVGGGVGYARINVDFDADSGKSRISDKFLNVFGTWFGDKWYVDGSLVAGLQTYRAYRTVYPGVWANNNHDGYQLTPHLGAGYKLPIGNYITRFFAGIDYAYSFESGYQETGAPLNNIYQKSRSASMMRLEGGAAVSQTYEKEFFSWTPTFKLSVVNKNPIQKGRIISADGNSVTPSTKAQTFISPGIDASVQFSDGWSFGLCYNGEFAAGSSSNEMLLKIRKSL